MKPVEVKIEIFSPLRKNCLHTFANQCGLSGRGEILIKPPARLCSHLSACPPSFTIIRPHNAKYQPFSDPSKINKYNWIKLNFLIFQLTDWLTGPAFFLPEQQWVYQLRCWAGTFYRGQAETNNNGSQTTSIAASHLGSIHLTNGSRDRRERERENNIFCSLACPV